MKRFISILFFATLVMISQASAESQMSVEVFDKNGKALSLSHAELESLGSTLPSVRKIVANIKESVKGGTNLYVEFQLKDGTWKKTAAGINGTIPIALHIHNLIKDELK